MQRLGLQFYAFFTVVLCGSALAFLFDLLRVARGYFRPNWWLAAVADLLFWLAATVAVFGGLFYANWAELRFYVLVGILVGIGLYQWLASETVVLLTRLLLRTVGWATGLVISLCQRLLWVPVVFVARLLWAAVYGAGEATLALAMGILHLLYRLASWVFRPLRGIYRCLRLSYLLMKRRRRRRFRS